MSDHQQDFSCAASLPHKCGVDLCGEGVVLKGRDLTEDFREEQVDEGDGDGRKILEDQTDQPVGAMLRNTKSGASESHSPNPGSEF